MWNRSLAAQEPAADAATHPAVQKLRRKVATAHEILDQSAVRLGHAVASEKSASNSLGKAVTVAGPCRRPRYVAVIARPCRSPGRCARK